MAIKVDSTLYYSEERYYCQVKKCTKSHSLKEAMDSIMFYEKKLSTPICAPNIVKIGLKFMA